MTRAQYEQWMVQRQWVLNNEEDDLEPRCLKWLCDHGKLTDYIEIEWIYLTDAIIAKFPNERSFGIRIPIAEVTDAC